MPEGLIVLFRSTFAFFSLFVLARMLGNKQLSQLTFFDYILGITIGSIAASMSVDLGMEAIPSLVGLITWTLWVIVFGLVGMYSRAARKLIEGEPTVVVQNGQVLESNLKQLNYNLDDLLEQLRDKGIFRVADVEFAVLEPGGSLSVLKKSQQLPVTPADLNIPTGYKGLSVELITDGNIVDENLKQLNLSKEWLMGQVRARGHELNEIFYAEIDSEGNLYIDLHDDLDGLPEDMDISDK